MIVCSGSHSGWLILPVHKFGEVPPPILLPLLRNIRFDHSFCINVVLLSYSGGYLAGIMTIMPIGEDLIYLTTLRSWNVTSSNSSLPTGLIFDSLGKLISTVNVRSTGCKNINMLRVTLVIFQLWWNCD